MCPRYDGICKVCDAVDSTKVFGQRPLTVFADSPEEAKTVAVAQANKQSPPGKILVPCPETFRRKQTDAHSRSRLGF